MKKLLVIFFLSFLFFGCAHNQMRGNIVCNNYIVENVEIKLPKGIPDISDYFIDTIRATSAVSIMRYIAPDRTEYGIYILNNQPTVIAMVKARPDIGYEWYIYDEEGNPVSSTREEVFTLIIFYTDGIKKG